ncbi:MAG: HD domain-containing protein [Sphaerochaetaceae bacterium]
MDFTKLEEYLLKNVSSKRLKHLYSTAHQMVALVEKYLPGYSPEQAYLAGLWHDASREWSVQHLLDYCNTRGIRTEEEELEFPLLLHGPVAASLLEPCSQDIEAVRVAIRWHTLGSVAMGPLGGALFIADYIEPLRPFIPIDAREAFLDCATLEELCLKVVYQHKIYLAKNNMALAQSTLKLEHFLTGGGIFSAS